MSSIARKLVVSPLLVCFLAPLARAQAPGEVLWSQKISAAQGNGPKGIKTNDQFGRGACVIGDLDGDGVPDLAVSALGDDDNTGIDGLAYGAVWILFMNRDGTVKSHHKISRSSAGLPLDPGDEWGRAVRELGDFDLDGVPDIAVGTCYDDDNGTDKGAVYLLFLNRDGSVKQWKKISEISGGFTGDLDPDDEFGRGVRCLGDLDLDGVPDLGVGAIRDDDGGRDRGCYWILFMKRDGTVKGCSKLSETQGNFQSTLSDYGEFGFDCAVIGDRNGDGIQDIAISAPDQKTDGLQQGAVFIVYLNRNGTAKADFRIAENHANFNGDMLEYDDEFGCCVDAIGDLDRDGNIDIAVGAGKDDDGPAGSFNRGAVYVLLLNHDGTVKAWQKISALYGRFYGQIDQGDRFGTSLAWPGDLNGDGISDVFTGVRFDDDGGSGAGCLYFLALNDGTLVPPVAKFAYAPKRGKAPLDVQFTDQSTGNVTSWSWDFGDGATSTLQNPLHTYLVTGLKSVSLTVRGPAGSHRRLLSNIIKVDPPVLPLASFTGTPTIGMAPLDVQFMDASTGLVTSRSWDFGDGATSSEQSPHHVYALTGRYTVALTIANVSGASTQTRTEYVVASDVPPPCADFGCDVVGGVAPLAVQFGDASGGSVSAWAWSFGDGAASNAQNPRHTYVQPGTYTVALTASGPGGSDTRTRAALVGVASPPAPVADFAADVTSGIDPLPVAFSDLSSGLVTSWSWSFGDGSTANGQNPTHTYVAPGLYGVSLVATGPGGSDDLARTNLIDVHSVVRGIQDPSFELQTPGTLPSGAWTTFAGRAHVVEPAGGGFNDGTLPTNGARWLRLSAAGTSNALPPATPGGVTAPALGGAGVQQAFYLDDPLSVLEFDAAFVRGGPAASAAANDWMSVDVSDGATTVNLFYADTFTPTPNVSSVLGLPRTPTLHVKTDLRPLFPGSARNTRFVLRIQAGNGGADSAPSFALVDHFHLEQALASALRYGCGTNPPGSLSVLAGAPRLGTTLTLGVDNPLGTQGANSRAYVWMSLKPDAAYPCGTLLPNLGMAGPGANGEVLVNRTTGVLVKTVTGGTWSLPGTPAAVPLAIPTTASLLGTPLYVQGYLVDSHITYGIKTGLTDALKLLVGP